MADLGTFPTLTKVLHAGSNVFNFLAGEAITAGQVVCLDATGEDLQVMVHDLTLLETPIGVAVTDIASGDRGPIACTGCIVEVVNYSTSVAIDAGDLLQGDDNAIGGTVGVYLPRAARAAIAIDANDTITWDLVYIIGVAVEDIAASGHGKMLVQPQCLTPSYLTVVT